MKYGKILAWIATVAGAFGCGWIFGRKQGLSKSKDVVVHIDPPVEAAPAPEPEHMDIPGDTIVKEVELHKIENVATDPVKVSTDNPYIITEDDYQFKYSRFNELALVYYQDDGILVNESNDIPVEHPDKVIGPDALWELEQTDGDSLYVHDPSMMTNYEIRVVHGGIADDIFPDDDEGEFE